MAKIKSITAAQPGWFASYKDGGRQKIAVWAVVDDGDGCDAIAGFVADGLEFLEEAEKNPSFCEYQYLFDSEIEDYQKCKVFEG